MKKNKIKLSLIDDYINIVLIKNFFNNSFAAFDLTDEHTQKINNSKSLDLMLEKTYISLFEKLNLKDLSFDILTKELEQNNSLFLSTNQANIERVFNRTLLSLNSILNNLSSKLKQLKVSFNCENIAKN